MLWDKEFAPCCRERPDVALFSGTNKPEVLAELDAGLPRLPRLVLVHSLVHTSALT